MQIEWVLNKIHDLNDETPKFSRNFDIVFVTNKVHARRVNFMNWVFFPKLQVEYLHSNDAPPPIWHEVLAYGKLVFHFVGLGDFVEALRRKLYNG